MSAMAAIPLNFHKNLLAMEPPCQRDPHGEKTKSESERRVLGLCERCKPVVIDPGLNADLPCSVRYFENETFFCSQAGKREDQDGIGSQPQEGLVPIAPAVQIDQPRAERQQQARSTGGKEHIGARPQRLVDREERMPGVP